MCSPPCQTTLVRCEYARGEMIARRVTTSYVNHKPQSWGYFGLHQCNRSIGRVRSARNRKCRTYSACNPSMSRLRTPSKEICCTWSTRRNRVANTTALRMQGEGFTLHSSCIATPEKPKARHITSDQRQQLTYEATGLGDDLSVDKIIVLDP